VGGDAGESAQTKHLKGIADGTAKFRLFLAYARVREKKCDGCERK